jgi:hypothetical protein
MTESNLRASIRMQMPAENSHTTIVQITRNETEKHFSGIADSKQGPPQ